MAEIDCPDCGFRNATTAKFCAQCGRGLGISCPTCGYPNEPGGKFCTQCGRELQPAKDAASVGESHQAAKPTAERRQLTVMFVDLVGSTQLSTRLDPEEMGEVIRAYQNAAAVEVARFEGHVAKFMGDGVLAYFGWPKAHEDEPERAVRAGLAIVEAVKKLATPAQEALAARIGIATGLVVVGDLVGEGAAQEEAVVGETPNLAARLQGLAEACGIVVAESTRRLLGELFELSDLGAHTLKGFAAPARAWRVVGERAVKSRFEAAHAAGAMPLIGRQQELSLLLDRWRESVRGKGQVVLLSGEPGIGKSRLTQALRERIGAEPHKRLRYQCSPYHANSVLHPVIAELELAAGLAADDPPHLKLEKLQAVIGQAVDRIAPAVPLLAALLSIPPGDRYPPPTLDAQQLKTKTFEALIERLTGIAARQPVLMILEDAHWIDPTTAELFELTIDRLHNLPGMLVVTFRPDFTPPWALRSYLTSLDLARLPRSLCVAMVQSITVGKALPPEVQDQIVVKTDGVPLFVEELTKTVLESGLVRQSGERYELANPLRPVAIPSTLHDSLAARLDRLPAAKEVAQIGAVIGREFSYDLLAAVAGIEAARLAKMLDQLVGSELLLQRSTARGTVYAFKHALVQDAAYATLLKGKRRELHRRIAAALEVRFPAVAEAEPELLAHHCAAADLAEKATDYWVTAAGRAANRSSHVEAVGHLKNALRAIETLPDDAARAHRELAVVLATGMSLQDIEGAGSPNVANAYGRARELCERAGDSVQRFAVLWGLWRYHVWRGDIEIAGKFADELASLARRDGTPGLLLQARHAQWSTAEFGGTLAGTLEFARSGLALYDRGERQSQIYRLSTHDPAVCGYGTWAHVTWLLGYPDQSQQRIGHALRLAEQLDHPSSMANALVNAVDLYLVRSEPVALQDSADRLIALATEQGFAEYLARAKFGRGFALVLQGRSVDGLALMRDGLSASLAAGRLVYATFYRAMLAEAHRRGGRYEEAGRLVRAEIEAMVDDFPARWLAAEVFRLIGESLASRASDGRALSETWLGKAIDKARRQDARIIELRATTSLARLWAERGERRRGHDRLAPIYGWFTEGFDTPDLKAAKALLEALA